jgi:hypothetical protein
MADNMYWAARCKSCSGMVGYRDVRYVANIHGAKTEEELPVGIINSVVVTAGHSMISACISFGQLL